MVGEYRIVEQDGPTLRAKIVDVASSTCRDVLPDAFTTAPMVTLGLDQGSIGTALVAFSNSMGGMIHCRWDKYHRIVRDVKLAFTHAAGGVFWKAQLYTAYLWSVNRKPFNSGAFGTQKKWMLEIFLETHDRGSSPLWQKYRWRIAEDLGMPFHTDEEQEAVWREVALTPSFNQACEDTKLGRWFSWNASARKYMREYNATKMLLESHVHDISDPDSDAVAFDNLESAERAKTPREQLAQLRSTTGGLRLAYKLMTTQLLMTARIMYVATMAGWSWYSREVTDIKTPQQGLRHALAASQGKWASDAHLGRGVSQTLYDSRNLDFMGCSGQGDEPRVQTEYAFWLGVHVLGNRTWAMAVRHSNPPEVYIGMLFKKEERVIATASCMREHWLSILRLEQRRLQCQVCGCLRHLSSAGSGWLAGRGSAQAKGWNRPVPPCLCLRLCQAAGRHPVVCQTRDVADEKVADRLVHDLAVIVDKPVRVMYSFYERDRFTPSPRRRDPGSRVLRGMLDTLPDNKIVEDLHNDLRRDSGANANTVQRTTHVQDIITHSSVLANRDVRHPSAVSKSEFIDTFKSSPSHASGKRHKACSHRLPKAWTKIMGRRTWTAISEDVLRTAAAAWSWLHSGFPDALAAPQGTTKLELGLLSQLLVQHSLVHHFPTDSVSLCLGNARSKSFLAMATAESSRSARKAPLGSFMPLTCLTGM